MKELTLAEQKEKFFKDKLIELEGKRTQANLGFKLKRELNAFIEDSREQGFHDMGKLNKMAANQIATQALLYRDKEFLDFMYEIKTHGGSNYGQTAAGQSLILKISDQIDNQNDLDEARAWDRKKRQKEQNLFQAYSALGELRNNRDQEGFEQKMEQWISNMNAQGFTKEAESAAKYEENYKAQKVKDETITFGDTRTDSFLQTLQNKGKSALIQELLNSGKQLDPQYVNYLIATDQEITPISNIKEYAERMDDFESSLKNLGTQKMNDFLTSLNLDPNKQGTLKLPEEFGFILSDGLAKIRHHLATKYRNIATMENGNIPFIEFNPDQRKLFQELMQPDWDSTDLDTLGGIYNDTASKLKESMDRFVGKKDPFTLRRRQANLEDSVYQSVYNKQRPRGTKVDARKMLNRFVRMKKQMQNDETTFATPLEEHIEEHFDGQNIGSWEDLPDEYKADIEEYLEILNDDIVELLTLQGKEPE